MLNISVILLAFAAIGRGLQAAENSVEPVKGFSLERYLGKWYEIARYDHTFERGLEECTAEYSMREDGKVRVLNSGYNDKKGKQKSAEGYAKFAGEPSIGELRVTFFWPFFGAYRVAILDKDYRFALIVGDDFDYMWILSRTPVLDQSVIDEMIAFLKSKNFDTSRIKWVRQKKAS